MAIAPATVGVRQQPEQRWWELGSLTGPTTRITATTMATMAGEAYAPQPVLEQGDPIAACARRFKTYDPASQTYIVRKGVRASCP